MKDTFKPHLFTPGPVEVPPEILLEQALPLTHHRTPEFRKDFDSLLENLKTIIGLREGNLFLLPSSGTGAMEAAVVNLFEPGDRVLALCNGFFSERFAEICQVYGLDTRWLEFDWGQSVDPAVVGQALQQDQEIKGVFTVFHDTSTGVVNDLCAIGEVTSRYSTLLVADAVTGAAVSPLSAQDWKVDCVVGASQKGLLAPPGLSFIALNAQAMQACQQNSTPRYYFDLRKFDTALKGAVTPSPWTPPIATLRALKKSTDRILTLGLEQHYQDQRRLAESIQAGVEAIGLELPVKKQDRSEAVTLVLAPEGIAPGQIVAHLKQDWGIIIAGGLGKFKDTAFRIGHLGHLSILDAVGFLFALEAVLNRLGYPCQPGASAQAVYQVLS